MSLIYSPTGGVLALLLVTGRTHRLRNIKELLYLPVALLLGELRDKYGVGKSKEARAGTCRKSGTMR